MLRIGIIYDTSFLMLHKAQSPQALLTNDLWNGVRVEYQPEQTSWLFPAQPTYEVFRWGELFEFVEIIPTEAETELSNLFAHPEKQKSARRARKDVVSMIRNGATEVSLAESCRDRQAFMTAKTSLGADSSTDRLILAYALSMIQNREWCAALVATDDGGILYDALKLQKAGKRVWCFTKDYDPCWESSCGNLEDALADLTQERWESGVKQVIPGKARHRISRWKLETQKEWQQY